MTWPFAWPVLALNGGQVHVAVAIFDVGVKRAERLVGGDGAIACVAAGIIAADGGGEEACRGAEAELEHAAAGEVGGFGW
jgi:hypothetical protein